MTVQPPSPAITRFWALFLALFLGYPFVLGTGEQVWNRYWLVKDGQPGTALVTKEHWAGHNVVVYQYRVNGKVYTGQARRSLESPKYANVIAGEKTVIFFSSSHPWLSAIDPPHFVGIDGLPVVLLAWLIEAGLVVTIINPNSRWALKFSGQRRTLARPDGDSPHPNIFERAAEAQRGIVRPFPALDGWQLTKDRLQLLGCGLLVVLGMAVIAIGLAMLARR